MNNKGFAITGILYTIFALFMLILFAALGNLSLKSNTLRKTLAELEDDFAVTPLVTLTDGYTNDLENNYLATLDGKYIFELNYELTGEFYSVDCIAYLKKGDNIPTENNLDLGADNPASNFTLIPADCNKYNYKTIFSTGEATGAAGELLLKEIYKFEDSD